MQQSKKIKKKWLFVDSLSFYTIFKILGLAPSIKTIYYFEESNEYLKKLISGLRRLKIIQCDILRVAINVGYIKDHKGQMGHVKIYKDARILCKKIRCENIDDNHLIGLMGDIWRKDKIYYYFEKISEKKVRKECLRIALARWIYNEEDIHQKGECVLLISRNKWHDYLAAYARENGVKLASYGEFRRFTKDIKFILRLIVEYINKNLNVFGSNIRKLRHIREALECLYGTELQIKHSPKIGSRYWYRTLDLDAKDRSELFWLDGSEIPLSSMVIYDYKTNESINRELAERIDQQGIKIIGKGPGINPWHSSENAMKLEIWVKRKIALSLISCILKKRSISIYILQHLWQLATAYAYWLDFYIKNRIAIDIGTLNFDSAQILAMDTLGGVTMAYQYTASNIMVPTTLSSSGENVQFIFSKRYEELRRMVKAPVDRYVKTGYIYDYAIDEVKKSTRIELTRKQLKMEGAEFYICFFDENSVDQWDFFASNEEAAEDYRFLFEWVISDPTIGIIFKPKKSKDLMQRISILSTKIDEAMNTNRCVFLTSENIYGHIYPAEAAYMADLAIGKLSGGTAAFEAFLTGKPALLIDVEGLAAHPFYQWDEGNVIFKDWVSLKSAVERYRKEPFKMNNFGNWEKGISDLDEYLDGKARMRMASYIKTVFKNIHHGSTIDEVLAMADQSFYEQWRK